MLETLVMAGNDRFRSNNPRIRKIPGAVAQTAGRRKFEPFLFVLVKDPRFDYSAFAFVLPVDGARFLKVSPIPNRRWEIHPYIVESGLLTISTLSFLSLYRDAKILEIYEGTKEIKKTIISKALLGN